MQKYNKREAFGALLAATVPAVAYSMFTFFNSPTSSSETIWSLLFIGFFSLFFVFSLGWLGYEKILKKRKISSIFGYALFGVIVGILIYLVFYLPVIISNLGTSIKHAYLVILNTYKLLGFLIVYGLATSLIFWFVVVRNNRSL